MTIFSITIGTNVVKGLLLGCLPIGAGIGALAGTKLIHVFSRRKFILLINLVAIIAGSLLYINNFILNNWRFNIPQFYSCNIDKLFYWEDNR